MKNFNRQSILLVGAGATAILGMLIVAAAFWWGDLHAQSSMHITRVDPTTLAQAMLDDHFYSDYRHSTLLMTGTVNWVNQQSSTTLVRFMTHSRYVTRCSLDPSSRVPAFNEPVEVLAEGGTAQRQSDGVLLTHCIVL